MIGNNENFECRKCDFDTYPVVAVNYQNWDYCPVCGSELRNFNQNIQEEDETHADDSDDGSDMTTIPIGGEGTEDDGESNNSADQNQQETDGGKDTDDEEFVKEELDRLRSRYGSKDGDNSNKS